MRKQILLYLLSFSALYTKNLLNNKQYRLATINGKQKSPLKVVYNTQRKFISLLTSGEYSLVIKKPTIYEVI